MSILLFLLALCPRPLMADSAEIWKAWNSQDTRREVGFLVFSYYSASSLSPSASDDNSDGTDVFSDDLDSFLESPGLDGDCALVQALWFDMGEDCASQIEDEIMDRGPRMIEILDLGLKENAKLAAPPADDNDCDIVRVPLPDLKERYQECIDGIRQDIANRSL
jgi:hypothetical protein